MRVALAILYAFFVFLLSWMLNAIAIAGIAFAATSAGVKPGIFLFLNILLVWILSPGLGSGVAMYAAGKKFKDVEVSLILVGFVTVCIVCLTILFSLSLLIYSVKGENFWSIVLLLAQGTSVLVGAKVGKNVIMTS